MRFRKRRRKSRKPLTKTKVLRFTRHELFSNDRDKKKILARKLDTDKPIILRTRKLALSRIKKPIVKDNDYYDYKPIYNKTITELNNKKFVCEKRKVRRSVILARGFGGAHHKKRNWTDDSKVRC